MPLSIERILDHQVRLWHILSELDHETGSEAPAPLRPVFTLSRQLGCDHDVIARGLAARLGLQVHGRSLIDAVARDEGLKQRVAESLDERTRSELDIWVESLLDRRLFSHDVFHMALVRVVRTLANHGGMVFIGRGANLILEGTDCLRIRIIASRDTRVAKVARFLRVDAKTAIRMIDESDRKRTAFIRKLFRADWSDPEAYDIVLNTDLLKPVRLVDVIIETARARGLFTDTPSATTAAQA
jgi:cytidylate kinase